MLIYPFIFVLNVILQATIGFKTNNWETRIFFILAFGIILLMLMIWEAYRNINKTIKENNNMKS